MENQSKIHHMTAAMILIYTSHSMNLTSFLDDFNFYKMCFLHDHMIISDDVIVLLISDDIIW